MILSSFPVVEMNKIKDKMIELPDLQVATNATIAELLEQNDGSYEINMSVKPDDAEVFGFSLGNSKGELLVFKFDNSTGFFSIDRKKSGLTDFNDRFAMGMSAPLIKRAVYNVRLLIDRASAEIFINEGEITMTTLFFPVECMNQLRFFSRAGKISVENIKINNIK